MSKKDKDDVIRARTQSMVTDAQRLHGLSKKRKEVQAEIKERQASMEHSISENISSQREQERKKRIKLYGEVEEQRQQITSSLVQQLVKACEEENAPAYIVVIGKLLDNFQGTT